MWLAAPTTSVTLSRNVRRLGCRAGRVFEARPPTVEYLRLLHAMFVLGVNRIHYNHNLILSLNPAGNFGSTNRRISCG
jgi:hypothetical protein